MGRFDVDDASSITPVQAPKEYRSIKGSYECQQCRMVVRRADYYPKESRLVWVCPDNHESEIVGFMI